MQILGISSAFRSNSSAVCRHGTSLVLGKTEVL